MNTAIIKEPEISPSRPWEEILRAPQKKRRILALLLFTLSLIVYNPASRCQFVNYDDPEYITNNAHVQQGLHWHTLRWAFTSFEFFNWHPLTWISYLVDYQLFKLNPTGYHLMNIFFHGLSSALLFVILYRITGYLWRSLSVALLFAVHPFNVESVAWVSELKNVLSTVFWWLAIWAYGWYALKPGWKRYLAVAALFAMGLMAKPMVITLPCVLLLLDIWPLRRIASWHVEPAGMATRFNFSQKSWPSLVFEKLPLFILSALSGLLTIVAQRVNGGMEDTIDYPVLVRLKNALVSYATYICKTFWPTHFAIYYPHPGNTIAVYKIALSSLLLAGITIWVVRAWRIRPYLLVGWLWFLGTLVPTIGLLQNGNQAMADRYIYIPIVGIFLIFIWELAAWIGKNRPRIWIAAALGSVALILLIADTEQQLRNWRNSVTLFSHATNLTQNNDLAEMNLGAALAEENNMEEAGVHFHKALLMNPNNASHRYNYGYSLFLAGDNDRAIRQLNVALEIYNLDTRHRLSTDTFFLYRVHYNLGVALFHQGKKDEAYQHFTAAARIDPDHPMPLLMMGLLDLDRNQLDDAYREISESLQRNPSDIGYAALGMLLERQGRFQEAKTAYQTALAMNPDWNMAKMDMAALESKISTQKEGIQPAIPAGH